MFSIQRTNIISTNKNKHKIESDDAKDRRTEIDATVAPIYLQYKFAPTFDNRDNNKLLP